MATACLLPLADFHLPEAREGHFSVLGDEQLYFAMFVMFVLFAVFALFGYAVALELAQIQLSQQQSAEKERQVEELQQQNESLRREMAQQLQRKYRQLQLAQQQSTEKERQVEELQQQLFGTSTVITQLELCLKTRDDELQMVKKMSRAKDSELDQMCLRVKASEEMIYEQKQTIMTNDIKIAELGKQVQNLDRISVEKDAKYEAIVESSEAFLVELTKKQDEISHLKQQLEKVKELPLAKKPAVTHDSATQANYLSVSGESVCGVEECGETVLEITGSKQQKISWEGYGLHLTVPEGAVSSDVTVSLAVKAISAGYFGLPNDIHLVSSIYWVTASEPGFNKDVSMHLEHGAIISSEEEASQYKFIVGNSLQEDFPYTFKIINGVFPPQSQLATISFEQSSFIAAVFQGKKKDLKVRYLAYSFLKQISQTYWTFSFLVTIDIAPMLQLVKQKYTDSWVMIYNATVEFLEKQLPLAVEQEEAAADMSDDQSITLDITAAEEAEAIGWDIYPLTSIQIMKKDVGISQREGRVLISHCLSAIDWSIVNTTNLPVFKCYLNLLGAKAPNKFILHIDPPSLSPTPVAAAACFTTSATACITTSTTSGSVPMTTQGRQLECSLGPPLIPVDICDQLANSPCVLYRLADILYQKRFIAKDVSQTVKANSSLPPYENASRLIEPAIEHVKRNPEKHKILVTILSEECNVCFSCV